MQLIDFARLVLPQTGDYFTARLTRQKKLLHTKHTSIDSVVKGIQSQAEARFDTYFATGSYDGRRRIDRCRQKKIWYVDIDCKPGGQYPSKRDALKALKAAIKKGLIRPSLIVDTGGGFHLYWALDVEVPHGRWRPYADRIKAMCSATNLDIDAGVTQDGARLLRAPNSVNYKDPANPRSCKVIFEGPVYTYEEISTKLKGYTGLSVIGGTDANNLNDDLSAGLSTPSEAPPAKGMLEDCPFMANQLATQGADTPEVLWHKVINTLAYTSDGEDYIHKISEGYADYTPHATNNKWQHALEQREKRGATLCSTFAKSGATECAQCPLRDKGKSPISLAFKAKQATPLTDDELPYPYRNNDSTVERYDSETQTWETVLPGTITHFSAALDRGIGTFIEFRYKDIPVEFALESIFDAKSFAIAISKFGIQIAQWEYKVMNSVVYSFLDRLNRNRTMQSALSHYGWVDEGFHAGGTVFGKGGENSYNIKIDPNTSSLYTPVGDLGVWTQCANHILAQNRPAAWTVIASAFAAPLIPFTGTTGSVLSLLSPTSGITGKSTALKVAQSVWGHPVRGIAHLNDTPASVVNRLGVLHNLPSYWDEVRGKEEASEFIKTIFRLSQGKERQRLNSDITQRRSGTWATLLTIATNDSLIDHISNVISNSDAGAARVFEIEAETINDNLDDGTARQFYLRLHDNYGNAGRVYAEFIGSRKEEIKRAVAKYEQQLCKDLHTAGDERFWTSTLTTLLVSAAITNKLNLTKFNLKKFRTYLIKQLRKHRAFKLQEFVQGSASATKTLDQYLHHNVEYTVHADLLPVRGNINSIRIDSLKKPAKIRLAHKSNHIRIITQDFKDWIYATKGAGAEQIVQDLITMGAVVVRGSIDAGSPVSVGVRHRCLDVKFVGAFSHLMPTSGGGSGSVNEDSPEDLNADLSLP